MKQMTSFVTGERSHDEVEIRGILNQLKAQDLQDILAYLTLIQAGQP
jgi:cytochrome c553